MRRIPTWIGCSLLLLGLAWPAEPQPPQAVAVVLTLTNGTVASVDLSFARRLSHAEVARELAEVQRWTEWILAPPKITDEASGTSCQVAVTAGGTLTGSLTNLVWRLVAALAPHRRLAIAVLGAPVVTAPLTVENRFVTLTQSGGQGVQSYQVQVKDTSFRNLDQLRQPATVATPDRPQRRGFAAAWLVLVIASLAVGVAAYLLGRGLARRSPRT